MMLAGLGRSRNARLLLSLGIAVIVFLYHWATSPATPPAPTALWVSNYEIHEAAALNGIQSSIEHFDGQTSQAQFLKTCRLGVHDVTTFQSEPQPPNPTLRTIYAKFLAANLVLYTECVDGIMKADTNELNKMVSQANVVGSLTDQFNKAGTSLGFLSN